MASLKGLLFQAWKTKNCGCQSPPTFFLLLTYLLQSILDPMERKAKKVFVKRGKSELENGDNSKRFFFYESVNKIGRFFFRSIFPREFGSMKFQSIRMLRGTNFFFNSLLISLLNDWCDLIFRLQQRVTWKFAIHEMSHYVWAGH